MAFRLPRLPRRVALVERDGQPNATFQKLWQSFVEDIETALNTLQDAIDAIEAAGCVVSFSDERLMQDMSGIVKDGE